MFSDSYYVFTGPANETLMTITKKSTSPRNWAYVMENGDTMKLQGEFPKLYFITSTNQFIASGEKKDQYSPWEGILIFVNPAVNVPLFWCIMMLILQKYKNRPVESH